MSINGWNLLFSHKKEENTETCYNTGEHGKHGAEWKKPTTKKKKNTYHMIPNTWDVWNRPVYRDESRLAAAEGWGARGGGQGQGGKAEEQAVSSEVMKIF